MAPTRSQLLQVAAVVIEGFRTWTIKDVLAPRCPDCIQQTLPASFRKPPEDNDDLAAWLERVVPLVEADFDITFDPDNVVIDEVTRKVVLHAKIQTLLSGKPFRNESISTITVKTGLWPRGWKNSWTAKSIKTSKFNKRTG